MQFWELDTDHDFIISREDLIRYGNHSLTYRIIDRIFQMVCCSSSPTPILVEGLYFMLYIVRFLSLRYMSWAFP